MIHLAALYGLNLTRTKELWTEYARPEKPLDRGRLEEWTQLVKEWPLDRARNLIGQIVLVHRSLIADASDEMLIKDRWLNSFRNRIKSAGLVELNEHKIDLSNIGSTGTPRCLVFALIAEPLANFVPDRNMGE